MPNSLGDVFREFCLIYECSKAPISILKTNKKMCLQNLFMKRDTMAVMPTGFGKSLIFQSLALFTQESYVLVVVPLKSIIADQISELTSMGITACSLDDHIDKSMVGNIVLCTDLQKMLRTLGLLRN